VTRRFEERAEEALQNRNARSRIEAGTTSFRSLWADLRGEMAPDLAAYQARARRARERSLANLQGLAAQFADRATAAGAAVHFAGDAEEARAIVLEIAKKSGARTAVKMKSMLTEELELREFLDANGVATEETDVGEWILQLADEAPCHIIKPALHKTVDEIKTLFDRRMGPGPGADASALVDRARRELRPRFIAADLGITGVNFAVAETGTLVLVSNEGNGRLTSSAPPVHVALVPVEKLVSTLDEMTTLLKLLPRAATGQIITTYVTWITGPRKDGELDGPRELHIVLVDNGRSRALAGDSSEALLCLRCGACLNACPIFARVGGQTYDSVYSGPIGIVFTPFVTGMTAAAADNLHASTLCGACAEVCPVGIDLPHLILKGRHEAVAARRVSRLERWTARLVSLVLRRPALYRLALRLGRPLVALWRNGWLRPVAIRRWTGSRRLFSLAKVSFRERLAARSRRP
jgi:L-lactate dehydrogenase complex protein LldF